MQAAQGVLARLALIGLHETGIDSGLCEQVLPPGLHEIAARIADDIRLDQRDIRDLSGTDLH